MTKQENRGTSEELSKKDKLYAKWKNVPGPLRKTIVLVIGITLLAIGGVLVILPGPFTLPFVIAALAILASEFVWAERIFAKGKQVSTHVVGKVKQVPIWIIIIVGLFIVTGVGISAYYWFTVK